MYEVERLLGRGATGVVELATAPDGSRVALKRIAFHGSAEALAAARTRLRREAEVLGRLDHPGIVGLLDVLDDGGDLVLVMPWFQGGSLADRVAAGGPLPPDEVEALGQHLLAALAAAHRAGVVHRDVKPANVLLDEASRPHLADFGVATARGLTAGLTADGGAVGTPGFLSPEQARGEAASAASDVFGLGATLRWAATGDGPYGAGSHLARDVLLHRAAKGKVTRCPRSLPEGLRRRIDAMLEPRPERRPTAAALAGGPDGTVVSAYAAGRRRAAAVLTGGADASPPGGDRRPVAALSTLGVVAACAVSLGLGLLVAGPGGGPEASGAGVTTTIGATTSTSACAPLQYQPCGGEPAPGTNGSRCIDLRADYDGDRANGCEAVPDDLDGVPLVDVHEPTIVPAGDVDEFPVPVGDGPQVFCDGAVDFRLTAPPGMTLRLEIRAEDGRVLGEATAAEGRTAPLRIHEPDCGGDDAQTLTASVTAVGSDRTALPYRLERRGDF